MAASVETLSFPLLEVENLSKRFGDSAALTSISFSVREKEIVGVIGPNGSGKTTLLECIAGLLHPDSGTIAWQNRAMPRRRRKKYLFYLPDGILPDGEQSVRTILKFYGDVFAVKAAQVHEILAQLSLEKVLAKPAFALSTRSTMKLSSFDKVSSRCTRFEMRSQRPKTLLSSPRSSWRITKISFSTVGRPSSYNAGRRLSVDKR
jgi:ABC-type glutathione transport system ATPase component